MYSTVLDTDYTDKKPLPSRDLDSCWGSLVSKVNIESIQCVK